jgi:hypothetical protein
MSQEDSKQQAEVVKEEVKAVASAPVPVPVVEPVIQHVSSDKFECKDGVLYKNGIASGHC